MTAPTRELLIAEYENDMDLPYRSNLEAVPTNMPIHREDVEIILLDNAHMLGSVQVAVTLPNGLRCGYSGDFNWPLDDVIQVDELVLDCTYGSPKSVRKFTQEEANYQFIELVTKQTKLGPVLIKAHRGTLQRAISCLNGIVKNPIIATPKLYRDLEVYQRYGYNLTEVIRSDSEEAKLARSEGRYIEMCSVLERNLTNPENSSSIIISAYMSKMEKTVVQYSEGSFAVALSDHADYVGTLEYVRTTGARKVVTDNTRGGKAVELALALKRELGIDAQPSQIHFSKEWGT
jgi:putative mRNA 3-end processing factor